MFTPINSPLVLIAKRFPSQQNEPWPARQETEPAPVLTGKRWSWHAKPLACVSDPDVAASKRNTQIRALPACNAVLTKSWRDGQEHGLTHSQLIGGGSAHTQENVRRGNQ